MSKEKLLIDLFYHEATDNLRNRSRIEVLEAENARLKHQLESIKKIKMGDHTDLLFGDVPHIFKRKSL